MIGLPEKILHFTITETLQMAISKSIQPRRNVLHVEKYILHQQHTTQGNFIIFPTQVAKISAGPSFNMKKHSFR